MLPSFTKIVSLGLLGLTLSTQTVSAVKPPARARVFLTVKATPTNATSGEYVWKLAHEFQKKAYTIGKADLYDLGRTRGNETAADDIWTFASFASDQRLQDWLDNDWHVENVQAALPYLTSAPVLGIYRLDG